MITKHSGIYFVILLIRTKIKQNSEFLSPFRFPHPLAAVYSFISSFRKDKLVVMVMPTEIEMDKALFYFSNIKLDFSFTRQIN